MPGCLHLLPREASFAPCLPAFAFAAFAAFDNDFTGLVPFNAFSILPPGREVIRSNPNSCQEQFPVSHNNPFNNTPKPISSPPNGASGVNASNAPISCSASEISLSSFECFVTQSLNASHFSCSQLGFSSNRLLAWVLIQATAVFTSILSVDLIPAPLATSASNTVVARRCSAFAASNAAWAAANSDWAAVAVLAVIAFTPGRAAVATAVAVATFAVAAALTTFASHRL